MDMHSDGTNQFEPILQAGASGYIFKNVASNERFMEILNLAIETVLAEKPYFAEIPN